MKEFLQWAEFFALSLTALAVIAAAVIAHNAAKTAREAANTAREAADTAKKESERKTRLTSVNLVTQAVKKFAADAEMKAMFYEIEYGQFKFDSYFQGSFVETCLDKLLGHFSAVALAWKGGLIEDDDLVIVRYYVLRIMRDDDVVKYVEFLRKWVKHQKIGSHPYESLTELHEHLEETLPHKGE